MAGGRETETKAGTLRLDISSETGLVQIQGR